MFSICQDLRLILHDQLEYQLSSLAAPHLLLVWPGSGAAYALCHSSEPAFLSGIAPALGSAQHSCEWSAAPLAQLSHLIGGTCMWRAVLCLAFQRHPISDMFSLLLAKWCSCTQRRRYGVCCAEHGSADAAGACRAEG